MPTNKKSAKKYCGDGKSFPLLAQVQYEGNRYSSGKNKKLLKDILSMVLHETRYTIGFSSLSKKIKSNSGDMYRTFELLCPTIDNAPLVILFNYNKFMNHFTKYLRLLSDERISEDTHVERYFEKDLIKIRNGLEHLVAGREQIFWRGKNIHWANNVIIPKPTKIFKTPHEDENELSEYRKKNNAYVVQSKTGELLEISLPVRATSSRGEKSLELFAIRINPTEQNNQNLVRIFIHYFPHIGEPIQPRQIPLHIQTDQDGGRSVYSSTQQSNISSRVSRWYLYCSINEEGNKKIESRERRLKNSLVKFPNLSEEEIRLERRKCYDEIEDLKNKPQYQNITVKTRGLLLYALTEDNVSQFNSALENLSKFNGHDEQEDGKSNPYFDKTITNLEERVDIEGITIKTPKLTFNEMLDDNMQNKDSDSASLPINVIFDYNIEKNVDEIRKLDFPFLYRYHEFKHLLPEDFTSGLLKGIARELTWSAKSISSSELKYRVTSAFYEEIRTYFWKAHRFLFPSITHVDNAAFEALIEYHYKVASYIKFIERCKLKLSDWSWQQETNENKYHLLERKIISKIDSNDSVNNPIISIIEERDNPVNGSYLYDILKQIKSMYKDEYVITTSCFIAKWKANELRQMLVSSGLPISLDKAKTLFMNEGGMPEACMSGYCDIFKELGFNIRLKAGESSKVFFVFDSAAEDDRNNRVNSTGH